MEAFEKELGVRMVQAWGMTETSPLGSVAHPPAGVDRRGGVAVPRHAGPADLRGGGRLVGDDGERAAAATASRSARSRCAGPWVTGAYYKDDDPAKFRDGWLRTGDVGTIDPLRLRRR